MVQENSLKYDSIIILGATATGKTSLSIELAKKLNTEIINADSMYIYKDLNIGTAKPTPEEMAGVKHHLIGFVDADKTYNVSEYRTDAKKVINDFFTNKKLPIIVGGTGFYIDSLIKNYSYGAVEKNDNLREQLNKELELYGKEYLYNKLKELDYATYSKLHVNDTKRVIRALEIVLLSGNKKSDVINNEEPILKNPLIIGLTISRDILYDRINKRVELMLEAGLLDEVKNLLDRGLTPDLHQSMKGIGYKELYEYFKNSQPLDISIEEIKKHTRNYAKRQITWFKRNEDIIWFNILEEENLADKIINLLKKNLRNLP